MKLYLLKQGSIRLPASHIFADLPITDPPELITMPVESYLIETPQGRVLFDCGMNITEDGMTARPQAREYHEAENESLPARLAALGLTYDDIDYVVLSHLHIDHHGYLHHFKNARKVYVHKAEFTQWMLRYGAGESQFHIQPKMLEAWREAQLKWELLEQPETEILPGVTVYTMGSGHSYGMLCMMVRLAERSVFLAADTCYTADHFVLPPRKPRILLDEAGYMESIYRIAEITRKENAELWFGHDYKQFVTLKGSEEGYYE